MNKPAVKVWEEARVIPTYEVGDPEKVPMFLEKRAYQGSTGKTYPLPVTEVLSDERTDVTYQAVMLENEYLQVMILPEIGGRIQRAYDKTNGYDFVYYNEVIKPALVGLAGPWISGGIEFNWPQHHRPTTFSPVDYTLAENPDGSCTVYLSEQDRMYGTKGMASVTLHPGKAYIEIKGQVYNGTDLPQTFLWWANPAIPVNNHTYSVFPPDVNAVMDHGKRAVSTFPIATGEYYKYDYSAGVDISRFKNVIVPTSYMAANSAFDFIGNYDEHLEAGLLHVADHHISPGKKQWTWGNGDFGHTWYDSLTDSNGPYIELMTGVYTDNQPDFTWLKPHEEKRFVQYFMPYKGVGRVGNATKEAMVSLAQEGTDSLAVRVYSTAVYDAAKVRVWDQETLIYEQTVELSPEGFFEDVFEFRGALEDCRVTVSHGERLLVSYKVYKQTLKLLPDPAEKLPSPDKLGSAEALYLAALHLEQYRHATYDPADYYLEGLKRDPTDMRLNNGYGLLLLRSGQFEASIPFFEAAVKKHTWKNPNPYVGEYSFNLGLAYLHSGDEERAYGAFFKATWSAEMQNAGYYWLACLEARKKHYEKALEFSRLSLVRNWHDMKTRHLVAALRRRLGDPSEAFIAESLAIDPLSHGLLYEEVLSLGGVGGVEDAQEVEKAEGADKKDCVDSATKARAHDSWLNSMQYNVNSFLELAILYFNCGMYEDAVDVLSYCRAGHPLISYYAGYACQQLGRSEEAAHHFRKAESLPPDHCFPNKLMEIEVLNSAVSVLKEAPLAHHCLGNLHYDKKQYKLARHHWEEAVAQKEDLAPAYRNLSIVYFNKLQDPLRALTAIEKACFLDPDYPRYRLEYDQLAARMHISHEERLLVMEARMDITRSRDVLYLRYIALLNDTGRHEEALAALDSHIFHPWEGGEGKVSGEFRRALVSLAKERLSAGQPQAAMELLERGTSFPKNLGEGKLPNVPDNEIHYYLAKACEQLGDQDKAAEYYQLATAGSSVPERALYYHDQPSDYIFYQGLSHMELGSPAAALRSFHQLIIFGERHLFDQAEHDYFAVSVPQIEVYEDDIQQEHIAYCERLRALGKEGLKIMESRS